MEGHDLRRSRKASFCQGEPCFDTFYRGKAGGYKAALIGEENRRYFIEGSTNLRDWFSFTNGVSANGTLAIEDSETNQVRFYRAYRE